MTSTEVTDFIDEFMGHKKVLGFYDPEEDSIVFVFENVGSVPAPTMRPLETMKHPDEQRIVGFRIKNATKFVSKHIDRPEFFEEKVRGGRVRIYDLLVEATKVGIHDDFHCLRQSATLAGSSHIDVNLLRGIQDHYEGPMDLDLSTKPL